MRVSFYAAFVIGASLLLYNVFPKEITIILSLVLITLIINKWDILKTYF